MFPVLCVSRRCCAAGCEAGQGAFMAKLDLEAAYRHVPVHPDDQGLLAVKWGNEVYVDSVLPFGLRSAPKIFTAVAGLHFG